MTATATKALTLAMKLIDFLEEADIDALGFDLAEGDAYRTYSSNEIRLELIAGLTSLRQGPAVIDGLELHLRLRAMAKAAGSDAALARKIGISRQALHAVMMSQREAGPAILSYMRMRRVENGKTLFVPAD